MESATLIKRIVAAFPVERIPIGNDILYEGAYPGESELEEIRLFFGGRAWNSVTPSDVFCFRHALSFFSPAALAYYTAAWMTCALQDDNAVDTAIENLVSCLGRADPNLWTQEQRLVICQWLVRFNVSNLASSKQDFEKAAANLGCQKDVSQS
jgi:hypothetical protein